MAINLNKIQILILFLISMMVISKFKIINTISESVPYIHYAIPSDTTNCTHNGTTWVNPNGQIWNGTSWQ
jgi:hypothetical protein